MSDEHSPEDRLAHLYHRNGYARLPKPERREKEGSQSYKKGWEVRLVARDEEELAELHNLLEQMDFEPGSPFDKARQIVLPLYGRTSVQRFLEIVGDDETLKEHAETKEAMGVEETERAGDGRRLTEKNARKREGNPRAQRLRRAARKRNAEE